MPVYLKEMNHLAVVEAAIKSIKDNSSDHEIILVDDGSPLSGTSEYVLGEEVDLFVRHATNKGIAPSWNDGLKIAHGDYLVVVNDDIEVGPGWLQGLGHALSFPKAMVSGAVIASTKNGSGPLPDYKWFPGYCFMLPRKTMDTIGLFDEQFVPFNFEDVDYWTRILQIGGLLMKNNDVLIKHKEGHVLHTLAYDEVSQQNHKKYIDKWGFDPQPIFYGDTNGPWEL